MLSKLLQLNYYHTFSAYSGTEGVLLHNNHIDLILLDLMFPGKNGEETIKELQHKKNVSIIVISAIYGTDKKIDLLKLGADDYTVKCNYEYINLFKKEFEILKVMVENPNRVFTKNNLIE